MKGPQKIQLIVQSNIKNKMIKISSDYPKYTLCANIKKCRFPIMLKKMSISIKKNDTCDRVECNILRNEF